MTLWGKRGGGVTWTPEKPTETGWYWYRKGPVVVPLLLYCGAAWDHLVDFAGLTEPVAFMKDHLLEGDVLFSRRLTVAAWNRL